MEELVASDVLSGFVNSMPAAYRHAFDRRAIEEHAQLVERRSGEPGHAEVWQVQPRGLAVVCVVAPDQPGLLSVITSVFVMHGLAVVSAHVFCRQSPDGKPEAVDFFWVRRAQRFSPIPPPPALLERCVVAIRSYLCARIDPDEVPSGPPSGSFMTALRMGWEEDPTGASVLWLETTDFPGLLMAVAKALYESRLTIVRSEIETRGSRALDRFYLLTRELEPLDAEDRANVQVRIRLGFREWEGRVQLREVG